MTVESSPLAILTFIAAPAVLTNASSVLTLGTSNRFARNVDRSRQLMKLLEAVPSGGAPSAEVLLYRKLLVWLEERLTMLMRAMAMFYTAIGCFAAASLISLIGAVWGGFSHSLLLSITLGIGLAIGLSGLTALIIGGSLLVRETRLALATIREEMRFYRERSGA